MRLIVLGAGIGGLAAAVSLRREGHDVTVIERAPELGEVGAGVVLGPHAMRALEWLGADQHIRTVNNRPERLDLLDMVSGDHRIRFELGETGAQLYGADLYTTHRRDLIDALAGQLGDTRLVLGRTAEAVWQDDDAAFARVDDGTVYQADALIGADGLRSTVRRELFGETDAQFSGFLAWRTVLPTSKLGRELPDTMSLWMGCGRHVVLYPIRKGSQFYAAFYVPAEEIHREDWAASGNVEDLRQSFSDASPAVRDLVDKIDEAFITGIFYRDPLDQWCKGRILLVGDAAHPVLPTSGSGAGMAIEDAVTLARVLARHPRNIETAFQEFQARREPRTTRLLMSSKADLRAYQEENPVKIAAGAAMAGGISRLDPTGHARMQWLYGHDEVAQSAIPLDDIAATHGCKLKRPEAQRAFALWESALGVEDGIDGWLSERAAYDGFAERLNPFPTDAEVEWVEVDGVQGYRVTPFGCDQGPALLHLHGGYFNFGTARGAVALAARMARALGGWAFVPEYRLAPENDARAMLEDVIAAFRWTSRNSNALFVSAEDAGATLALNMVRAVASGDVAPRALFLLSPLVDLTLAGQSITTNAATDPWVSRLRLIYSVGAFIQGCDPADPEISPLFGDLQGMPPLRIFAAADEALIDDARKLCRRARECGVDAVLHEVADSVHRYALFDFLPESAALLGQLARECNDRGVPA